jgi:hypothetical protein
MLRRRRFKQTQSLSERLIEDAEQLKLQLATLPPGPERDTEADSSERNSLAY